MKTADVSIIGAGIIGCSIAWRLAQRGARVTLCDAGRLGAQASQAGAGMLAPGGEIEGDSPWAQRSIESLGLYPAFVQELEKESGVAIDYRACGALDLAYTEHELADIARKAALQRELGIASRQVDSREARRLVPALATDDLLAGRHYPDDAIVNPRDVLKALETVLRARGVVIQESSPAERVSSDVTTVLAAGAWSSGLVPGLPESYPVKGHLVGYDLRPETVPLILRHGHTYVLQRSNGFTIAGSTTERVGFDTSIDARTVARIHRRARRYLPDLLRASPDSSWTGLRPGIEGDQPQVGRHGESNLWLAYGHYRNGILLAPVTAQLIADGIMSSSEKD